MAKLERVAVFCGSSDSVDPAYLDLANELGHTLAAARIDVVYGGGKTGLMGAVAQAAMEAGAAVTGVLPGGLFSNGISAENITSLETVRDMHERKSRMYELADGFIGLPGGMGTYEEVFEAATWSQLGLHAGGAKKPVVLLDNDGFWAPVHALLDQAAARSFMGADTRRIIRQAGSVAEALSLLEG